MKIIIVLITLLVSAIGAFAQYTDLKGSLRFSILSLISALILFCGVILGGCRAVTRPMGWYRVADLPDNDIIGKALAPVADFADVRLDSVSVPGHMFIVGKLKPEKIPTWADLTESLIGHRLGFVYRDSVVTAPTINCRIESGSFTINSDDRDLVIEIYDALRKKIAT